MTNAEKSELFKLSGRQSEEMVDTPAGGLPSPPPPRPAFSLPPRPFGGIGAAVLKPQSATLKLKFTERDLGEASLDSKLLRETTAALLEVPSYSCWAQWRASNLHAA